jgi:hypothetical protein
VTACCMPKVSLAMMALASNLASGLGGMNVLHVGLCHGAVMSGVTIGGDTLGSEQRVRVRST